MFSSIWLHNWFTTGLRSGTCQPRISFWSTWSSVCALRRAPVSLTWTFSRRKDFPKMSATLQQLPRSKVSDHMTGNHTVFTPECLVLPQTYFKNICYSSPLLMWRFNGFLITLRLKFWSFDVWVFSQTFPLRTGRTCCQTTPGRSCWLRPVTSWWSTWDWLATWRKSSVQPPPLPPQSRAGMTVQRSHLLQCNFEAIQWNLWFIVIFCMVNCTF